MVKFVKVTDKTDHHLVHFVCDSLDDFREFESWCDEHIKGPFGFAEPNYFIYTSGPLKGQSAHINTKRTFCLLLRSPSDTVMVKLIWAGS